MTDADDRLLPALPSAVVVFEAGLFFFWLSFIESKNLQLLAHFSLDLAKFFFPDYQQTISRRLAKPEFASEASETSEMPFTFSTLKKWDSSYLGRLITLVFVDGFSISQRCWTAVDEETWLERFSRLASLALKSAFRSLRSIISANIWVWLLLDSASKDGRAQERALKSAG